MRRHYTESEKDAISYHIYSSEEERYRLSSRNISYEDFVNMLRRPQTDVPVSQRLFRFFNEISDMLSSPPSTRPIDLHFKTVFPVDKEQEFVRNILLEDTSRGDLTIAKIRKTPDPLSKYKKMCSFSGDSLNISCSTINDAAKAAMMIAASERVVKVDLKSHIYISGHRSEIKGGVVFDYIRVLSNVFNVNGHVQIELSQFSEGRKLSNDEFQEFSNFAQGFINDNDSCTLKDIYDAFDLRRGNTLRANDLTSGAEVSATGARKNLDRRTKDVSSVATQTVESAASIHRREQELEAAFKEQASGFTQDVARKDSELREAKEGLSYMEAQITALRSSLAGSEEDRSAALAENTQLSESLTRAAESLTNERDEALGREDALKAEIAELKDKMALMSHSTEASSSAAKAKENKLAGDTGNKTGKLKQQVKTAQKTNTRLQDRLKNLEAENKYLKETLVATGSENSSLRDQVLSEQGKVHSAETVAKDKVLELEQISALLLQKEKDLVAANKRLEEFTLQLSTLTSISEEQVLTEKELREKMRDLSSANRSLSEHYAELQKRLEELDSIDSRLRKQMKNAFDANSRLTDDLGQSKRENLSLLGKHKEEMEACKRGITALRNQKERKFLKIKKLIDVISKLESEKNLLALELADKEKNVEVLTSDIDTHQELQYAYQDRITFLEKRISSLSENMKEHDSIIQAYVEALEKSKEACDQSLKRISELKSDSKELSTEKNLLIDKLIVKNQTIQGLMEDIKNAQEKYEIGYAELKETYEGIVRGEKEMNASVAARIKKSNDEMFANLKEYAKASDDLFKSNSKLRLQNERLLAENKALGALQEGSDYEDTDSIERVKEAMQEVLERERANHAQLEEDLLYKNSALADEIVALDVKCTSLEKRNAELTADLEKAEYKYLEVSTVEEIQAMPTPQDTQAAEDGSDQEESLFSKAIKNEGEYKEILNSLLVDLKELQQENKELKLHAGKVDSQSSTLEDEISQLRDKLSKSESDLKKSVEENQDLTNSNEALSAELQFSFENRKVKERTVDRLSNVIISLKQRLADMMGADPSEEHPDVEEMPPGSIDTWSIRARDATPDRGLPAEDSSAGHKRSKSL